MNLHIKTTAVLLMTALIFTGCTKEQEQPVETTVETTVTEPEDDHTLLRPFTLNEAFADVTAGGRDFVFPIPLSELDEGGAFEDCVFEDNMLYFPDGSYAEADTEGLSINRLYFVLGTAPSDFSIVGVKLGDSSDIIYDTGIPDQQQGDMENGSVTYKGAGYQSINIEFIDGRVYAVYIVQ